MYVGKAKNLKNRVASYFQKETHLEPKTRLLVAQIKKIRYIIVESELESLLLEASFIKKYAPKYNVKLTDNKNYPLIRITKSALYPAVLTARKADDLSSIYFGPYPSTKAMRMVLRLTRRIFPYQSVLNHPKKVCFYHHLGLCPCVPALNNNATKVPKAPEDPKEKPMDPYNKDYRKTITHLINFLDGNTKKVIRDLEKERDMYSKSEDFESAQRAQKQIDAINYITHPVHKPFEYETNPNLREDLRSAEMNELIAVLRKNGVPVENVDRIECYDISNTQGTNPTASMVVLTNGEIDKSQYRKFKMRTKGPNDFAMMQEVLSRRLKHTEWETPGLIVVDGGKGQISSAKEVLDHMRANIPLVGLAKREEIIITPAFKEIVLPHDTKALQLVMRIRNEAHRFAITYHRKLRSRNFLP